jgi:hypothetical protein
MMDYFQKIENELIIRGVSYNIISDAAAASDHQPKLPIPPPTRM